MFIEEPKENYGTGWIKIYRSIHRHWLWSKPLSKMEAWIDILLEANHTQEKVNLGNELFTCDRGEKMYSLDTWGERWGWHKSKVRRFMKLLENDSMIELKSNRYTTHLKVSNYNTYQDMRNGTETEVKRKRNGSETEVKPIKELNNDKNDKYNRTFIKPTSQEVTNYAESIDFKLDGTYWVDHYEANGWMVGKNKMKDWKAAVRTWKKNNYNNNGNITNGSNRKENPGSVSSRLSYRFDPDKSAKRLETLKQQFGEGN